jgi:hypothetical protein
VKIKFSHNYPKLHDQKAARLLYIEIRDRSSLPDDFVAWDTLYAFHPEAHYQLPSGSLMVLVFLGNNLFPFTTVHRWSAEKERYYRGGIGKLFDIEVVATENCRECYHWIHATLARCAQCTQ